MSVSEPARAAVPMSKFSAPVQKVALAVGAVFLAVGVLGLVRGVTTHHGRLIFAGHHFGAALRGIFDVSVVHSRWVPAAGGSAAVLTALPSERRLKSVRRSPAC